MAALVSPPPFQDPPMQWNDQSKNWEWHPVYTKWLSDLYTALSNYLVTGRSTVTNTLYNSINVLEVPPQPTTQINSIVNPDDGLLVWDSTTGNLKVSKGGTWHVIF